MQGFPSGKLRGRERKQRDGNLAEGFECRSPALNAELCRREECMIECKIRAEIEREGLEQRPVAIYAHNADLAGGNDDELLTVNREIACGADDDVRRAAHRQGKLPSPFPTPCFIRPVILAA